MAEDTSPLVKTAFRAMGSRVQITLALEGGVAEDLLRAARGWFLGWERILSRFRAESELSRLNAAGGTPFRAGRVLWSVLRLALRAARETDGLVTPCVLTALEAAGYSASFEHIDPERKTDNATHSSVPDWRSLELELPSRTVRLPAEMRLDLGGFGKGWAAERCAQRLGKHAPALVDSGGDVAVSGPRTGGEAWRVAIPHPLDALSHLAVLPLLRGGLATSGITARHWYQAAEERHHLIDPRSGRPAETDILTVTVLAGRLSAAEAAAKAILILGSREGWDWLQARPGLAAILVRRDGATFHSSVLSPYMSPPG